MISRVNGYIKEKNGSKYLVFDSTQLRSADENKEAFKKYTELWDVIKNRTEIINSGKTSKRSSAEYGKVS